jgi:hypothetical protein
LDLVSDIVTYMRRIIKTPSDESIKTDLLIDYINRFYINDVSSRMNLFDLKTRYQFVTSPGIDRYNMPLYDIQTESAGQPGAQLINYYPVYQGFEDPCFVNGIPVSFMTQRGMFDNIYPNYYQTGIVCGYGDGSAGPYTLSIPSLSNASFSLQAPSGATLLRGHIDITGIIKYAEFNNYLDPPIGIDDGSTISIVPTTSVNSAVYFTANASDGTTIKVADSGQFLENNMNYGLLMKQGNAPYGNTPLFGGYSTTQNTINYFTGVAQNVYFPGSIPSGFPIYAQCYYYQLGIPRSVLFYNNVVTLRTPPNTQYVVDLTAYLSPAAFLNSAQGVSFGYMTEYIARGAARKLLSDVGDWDQFGQYESLYREQEQLVWLRSQRQFASTRTPTVYSNRGGSGGWNVGNGLGLQ